MADIAVYFDGSGLGGTVGSEDLWADVVGWESRLPNDQYLTLHHLVEQGWGDDLPALLEDLGTAISDHPPAGEVANGLDELVNIIEGRGDGDEAVAIALNEFYDGGEPATNELSHEQISSQLDKLVREKFGGPAVGDAGMGMGSVRPLDVWVVDVYDDHFVYRNGPKTYSQDYTVTDRIAKLTGDPVEVVRVTEYVPVKNDDGTVNVGLVENARGGARGKGAPSSRLNITPEKACQILKDGQVRGHPLTDRQKGLFGVICGRRKKARNAEAVNVEPNLDEVREAIAEIADNFNPRHDPHSGKFAHGDGGGAAGGGGGGAGITKLRDHAEKASSTAKKATEKANSTGTERAHRVAVDAHMDAHDAHMKVVVEANKGAAGADKPGKLAVQHSRKASQHMRHAQRHAEAANRIASGGTRNASGVLEAVRNAVRGITAVGGNGSS
jgi:hypothetical protein